MAQRKKSGKPAAKKTPAKGTPGVALAAAGNDPMGCCTWTNSGGQLMMADMRQGQCGKKPNSTFSAGVKCTG